MPSHANDILTQGLGHSDDGVAREVGAAYSAVMLYATRDTQGRITAVYDRQVDGANQIDAADPALIAFLAAPGSGALAGLIRSDLALARVLEDLIALLVDKGVIGLGELPEEARAKLARRRSLRGEIAALGPFGAEGGDKLI